MSNLSDSDRKAYEAYILAISPEERQEAIKKLIPGSHLYYHLYFVDRIKCVGSKLNEEDQKMMQQFEKKYPNIQELKEIKAKLKLLEYDEADSDEKRIQIIDELNRKFLNFTFDHYKPEDMQNQGGDSMSSQDGGSNIGSEQEEYGSEEDSAFQEMRPKVGAEKQKKTSVFDYEKYFSKNKIKENFKPTQDQYEGQRVLEKLPNGFEHDIDFSEFNPISVYTYATSGKGMKKISDLENPTFYESLKRYFENEYKKNKHFALQQSFCNALTIQQLDKLANLHPKIKEDKTFIGSYFQKQFNEELSKENQEVWSSEEKRANLLTLYNYTKSKNMPQSLQSTLLLEILELGIKVNIYDEDLFREYQKMPLVYTQSVFKGKRVAQADTHWNRYVGNVQTSQTNKDGRYDSSQSEMINKYLEHFCHQKGGSLEAFKEEFDSNILKNIEERVAIFNSDDMTNLNVDLKKYQSISQEVIVRFLESNQEFFKVDEEVSLQLELKNIQTIYIKIFEFNTETYYKKTLQPFNTGVNLDGLVASTEKTQEYKNPPNKKFIETFKFPELNGKIGLFIVEFIGNGMSSRAVIKKGSLSLIHKSTIAGHLAYILDENKKVCTGPKTGLYFNGQYFEANPEKGGKIFIPYGKTNMASKAIMMNNGFAQLCDFERKTENYTFNAWVHVNNESILIGNKASVVIKPTLLINNRQASVEILKNTKVTLTTISYIDSIPVTKTFENIKFKNNRELIIDFQVPPYLSNITVKLETEVLNITNQSNQKFNHEERVEIQSHQHSFDMNDLYLRKENDEYFVYLLGKNGEPRPKVNLQFMFMHIHLAKSQKERHVVLQTDKDGKVKLGKLKKVVGCMARCNLYNIEKNFVLMGDQQCMTYPTNIDSVENETIEFPVLFKKKTRKNVSLIKQNNEAVVLEDLYERVEFVKQDNKDFNLIRISGLGDGTYKLNLKKLGKKINITVNKGQYWDNDSFILKRNCLFENQAQVKMVKISNINVEENKQGGSEVTIKLEDFSRDTRVHAFATQYQSMIPVLQFFQLNANITQSLSKTVFPFANWKNLYMSNRELSDEFRYVFDRKYADRYLGNLLERPRLVLKRAFVQATTINQEVLKQGQQYQQQQIMQEIQSAPKVQAKMDRVYLSQKVARASFREQAYHDDYIGCGYGDEEEFTFDGIARMMASRGGHDEAMKISEFQNFLKNPPFTQFNLVPNENGEIKFSGNLNSFTQLTILVIDSNSVAQKCVSLAVNPTPKRDLSLLQPLNCEKGFTESRTTINLLRHEDHFIEDITSTEIQLIDDQKKIKGVLEELMKMKGTHHGGVFKELNGIVMKWNRLDKEEKNKQYYKNMCHEFHIFLYFKDQEYFLQIVRPFIQSKMEKTFIDYYLLEDFKPIIKYKEFENIVKLNALEKCFLIDALMKNGQQQDAERIVAHIKTQKEINDYQDVNAFNKIFDTVLNLNMLKVSHDNDDLKASEGSFPSSSISFATTSALQSNSIAQERFRSAAPRRPMQTRAMDRSEKEEEESDMGGMLFNDECVQEQKRSRPMPQNRMLKKKMRKSSYCDEDDEDSEGDSERYDIMRERETMKKKVRMQFEEIQTTNEYMETHYYKQTTYSYSTHLIPVNAFWADYAQFLSTKTEKDRQFLSSNFIQNADNQTAALLTFALLDLPFEAESHGYKTNESRGVEIKACGNLIMFKKEVREAPLEVSNDILVTHRYVPAVSGYETTTSSIPDEFLLNKAYACEVIMTNVSPQNKSFSVLYQIPQGSLPLHSTKYMKSIPQSLSPYTTIKTIFYFYFPKEGTFIHFPSNASNEEKIIARANTNELKVVSQLSVAKKESFRDLLLSGSKDEIIEFMKKHNLQKSEKGFQFYDLLWMLKDKVFFKKVINVLRERYIYNDQIWAYGFYHKDDEQICREYLMNSKPYQIFSCLGVSYKSKLIQLEYQDTEFKHLDYFPMINARAHSIGDLEQWTLNQNFKSSYEKFLLAISKLESLNATLKMMFVYCLQLQDRVMDAIQIFRTIDLNSEDLKGSLKIQYDYMNAYFDFFTGQEDGFKTARSIVRQYEDYPISSWRILFLEILDQLNEYDGEIEEGMDIDAENLTEEQKKQKYKQSIKKEPRLDCEVSTEQQVLTLEVANIKAISIKFYIIDAEILFSRTPFLKESTEEFSYVKPCHVIEKELTNQDLNSSIDTTVFLQQNQKFDIEIPQQLKNQNMVIEITGEGKQMFKTYYSTQIKVNLVESFGEIKVTDKEDKPLPKVYVKVFAQKKGGSTSNAFFFKDGYTDIRGKFEYAQTSGNKIKDVQKFAILVMSDNLGSIIRECDPPKVAMQSSPDDGDQGGAFGQQKQERIMNRIQNVNKKIAYKSK